MLLLLLLLLLLVPVVGVDQSAVLKPNRLHNHGALLFNDPYASTQGLPAQHFNNIKFASSALGSNCRQCESGATPKRRCRRKGEAMNIPGILSLPVYSGCSIVLPLR
jgi:hypothetical protein